MRGLFMVGLAVLVVAVIFAATWRLLRMLISNAVPDLAKQVFPVWAAQGPFESGAESAAAMRRAWLAISGPDQTEKMADAIHQHEEEFDADPEVWEETRHAAADAASPEALTMATGLKATERPTGAS
jgi:hypothetical protein